MNIEKMNIEKIAYNIKFFRELNGLTQEDLAKEISSSRSTIAKWENKVVVPDVASLIKLSDLFGISVDHLIGKYTFHNELVKEFKRIYGSGQTFDHDIIELTEYIMQNPQLKRLLQRLKNFPIKKQRSVQRIMRNLIDEYSNL